MLPLITARRKETGKLWQCSKERARNTHLRVEIFILKYCFIVELFKKVATSVPPLPHLRASFWRLIWAFWRPNLATFHVGSRPTRSPHRGRGGGWLGLPSRGLSPTHKELVFCLVLLNCMTSGPFSWCYILLLTQRFFWYYLNRKVMAILCCVAQKAASAAQCIFHREFFWLTVAINMWNFMFIDEAMH
jgi:hypothetical protein